MCLFRILILTLLCVFQSSVARGEQPRLEMDASIEKIDLSPFLWYLEDTTHQLDAQQLGQVDAGFAELTTKTPNFGFSNSTWWARAKVRNTANATFDVVISQSYVNADLVEFVLIDTQGRVLSRVLSGDKIRPEPEAERYRIPFAKLQIPIGDSQILVRVRTEGSVIFNIALESPISFYRGKANDYAFFYTMIGILFVMAAYNFLIWIQLRKLAHLFYVGFITFMALQATV